MPFIYSEPFGKSCCKMLSSDIHAEKAMIIGPGEEWSKALPFFSFFKTLSLVNSLPENALSVCKYFLNSCTDCFKNYEKYIFLCCTVCFLNLLSCAFVFFFTFCNSVSSELQWKVRCTNKSTINICLLANMTSTFSISF